MILFHRTSFQRAAKILRRGFRDSRGRFGTDQEWSGVWVSDRPLGANEGIAGGVLLQIEMNLAPENLAAFEWSEEGKPYREFLVPAERLNKFGIVTLFDD